MDEFNLDALDLNAAEDKVQQHLEQEANQVVEVSDDDDGCAGGACKI